MTKYSFRDWSGSEGQVGSLFQRQGILFQKNMDSLGNNLNEETKK